jgi:hypothetical protein
VAAARPLPTGLARPCSTARSSFCSVIGFSRKAMAPNLVASTAVSIVPWPLIMITGIVSSPVAPHSLSSVMPSTSGIQMSSSTRSGRNDSRTSRACAAFSATSTVWPSSVEDLRQQGPDAQLVVYNQNRCHARSVHLRASRIAGAGFAATAAHRVPSAGAKLENDSETRAPITGAHRGSSPVAT